MISVNNNAPAFNVFTNYTSNVSNLKRSMSRLSTGVKPVIDDPSGVGISERMRAQIRSTAMARQNVDNGISLIQTADSWLQKINDMLSRMHELAVEASDGTKTTGDINNIQSEFKQLQEEIARITSRNSAAAKYNGLFLFRGGTGRPSYDNDDTVASGVITIQIGADIGQKISLELPNLEITQSAVIGTVYTYTYGSTKATVLAASQITVTWGSIINWTQLSVGSEHALGKIAVAIDHVSNKRAQLGAQQNRLEQTKSGLLAYEDNLRAAESKVRDVDMARESTEFAKYQILTQVSNAMLAQANQIPAAALQLLG